MDYSFVERMDNDIEWLLENADLVEASIKQSFPITLNGETREVMFESLKYTLSLISNSNRSAMDDSDNARVIAMIVGGVVNEPDSSAYVPSKIERFHLNVTGKMATMETLWSVGGEQLETRTHTCYDFTTRQRLRVFAILRTRLERLFDNVAGLKDYIVDFDLVNRKFDIKFI